MDTSSLTGKDNLQLSGLDWLLAHHSAQESERRRMVGDLGLVPGNTVLDLGCGPGLWTRLLAERVAPNGKVFGLDFSHELIRFAETTRGTSPYAALMKFACGNFLAIPFQDATFDVVFFANCFVYVTDVDQVISEQKRITKQNGLIVGNHFDDALVIYHPIAPDISLNLLAATARALAHSPMVPRFDNYMGRKMHGIFKQAGLGTVRTQTYATQKVAPLNHFDKQYISIIADWQATVAQNHLRRGAAERWRAYFDPNSPLYILDRDDFFYCMVDIQTIGIKQ